MAKKASGKAKKPSPLKGGKSTVKRQTKIPSQTEIKTVKPLPAKRSRKPVKDKEWVTQVDLAERKQKLSLQRWWTVCGIWTYTFALVASFIIIYLNGFHAWGFTVSETFLKCLQGATVGQIGGLVLLLVKFSWK